MVLLIILAVLFVGVGLMVVFGERYAKPMEPEQQAKFSRIAIILVFVLLVAAIIKNLT
ncbi:MAG: hypothetical protein HRT37_01650 [Alteromonadaceae bacterium]|nr:hypothetical protein [Alteromonadaceae bacterium]